MKKRAKVFSRFARKTRHVLGKIGLMKKISRASTGIDGLDNMIEGGFERNSINLVVGSIGSGKSILALEFLLEGIKNGETVLYITFEEKKLEFYSHMKKFGWNLEELEKQNKFIFLEYSPEKVKMMLDEGGGAIESTVLKYNIKRMVIDSISSFSLLFDDPLSKRQANLGLFDIIDKWDCTTLLTVQHNPIKEKSEDLTSVDFEADSVIYLYFVKMKNKRQRFIEVVKMRGTDHSKETHIFEIAKSGIKIGKAANLKIKG
jgi:circadian clock protein KaiC